MTEPTAEQVEAERERAHQVLIDSRYMPCMHPDHNTDCDVIATALARRAIEARAAGRDEGLEVAERLARERADVAYVMSDLVAPQVRKALHVVGDAIRALRGRT